jgi:hypothetical protein
VNLRDLPEGQLRERCLAAAPGFLFFDPAGELIEKVTGKRATSRSRFSKLLARAWETTYTLGLDDYRKRMEDILERRTDLAAREQGLVVLRAMLRERPSKALRRERDRTEAELAERKARVDEAERELLAACAPFPKFLPERGQ